jgi:cell division protein FtsW
MIRSAARLKMPVDNLLFAATLALVVIGQWMVFDASYPTVLDSAKIGNDAFYFVKKQAVGAVIGLAALFCMMHFGYWRLRKWTVPLMLLALGLLCLVWIKPFGVNLNGANRWVKFGPVLFQPSELAKVALVLYLAALLSRPHCRIRELNEGLLAPLIVIGVTLLLIEREPDLGTAFVLFLAAMTQLFLAGARKRHLALVFAVVGLASLLAVSGFGHRGGRITTYFKMLADPAYDKTGAGYQTYHSWLAVGSGGATGMGLGEGREKFYLPQANTDFIFATMAEELDRKSVV